MVKCPECNTEISSKAESCPKCGHKHAKTSGCAKVAAIAIGIAVLFGIYMSNEIDDVNAKTAAREAQRRAALTPEQKSAEDAAKATSKEREDAQFVCQDFVRKTLQDPDSAQLADYHTYPTEHQKDGSWRIQVSGRARNGFNAMRELYVNCHVRLNGGNWRALSMQEVH